MELLDLLTARTRTTLRVLDHQNRYEEHSAAVFLRSHGKIEFILPHPNSERKIRSYSLLEKDVQLIDSFPIIDMNAPITLSNYLVMPLKPEGEREKNLWASYYRTQLLLQLELLKI